MSPRPLPPRRRTPGSRFLGILGALLVLVAYVAGVPPAPAQAIEHVRVELTSMTPRVATPGGDVTLSGTVTNTGATDLTAVQAYFWRDQRLRTTREELDPAAVPVGARYLPTFVPIGTDGMLSTGESYNFTVTMPASALGVPARDGVTMVGVHIRGSGGAGNLTLGRALAWLPVDAGEPQEPVAMASVVVLASAPSRVRSGLFVDDHLAEEVSSGGRLDELLDAAGRPGRSWLVDPALIVALQDMADEDGYTVADGSAGTGQDAAQAWLEKFAALSTEGHRLPYASADIELVGAIDRPEVLRDAVAAATQPDEVAGLPLAAWPTDGMLSEDGLAAVDALGAPVRVLAADVAASSTVGDRTVVAYDPEALATGEEMDDTALQMRQLTAATAFLGGVEGQASQVRVITDAASAAVDATDPSVRTALSSVPTTVGLPATPEVPPGADPDDTDDPAGAAARRANVVTAVDDRDGLETLFTEPDAGVDMTARLVSSLASSQWQDRVESYEAFRAWEREQADAILRGDALTISAQPVLLTAREDTQFPVTVSNNLAESVAVRLVFTSDNNDRLHVPSVDVPMVGAGESAGVIVVPQVEANGPYTIVAQLTTPAGRPVGKPVEIDVQATQAGRVGWILMIVSGIVVVGTTLLRIKQVRAERSRA